MHHSVILAYNPNRLLDAMLHHLRLHSDSALSRKLNVTEKILINIRRGAMPVAASMLLWMHEVTGISVQELRSLLGDRRATCRPRHVIRSATAVSA